MALAAAGCGYAQSRALAARAKGFPEIPEQPIQSAFSSSWTGIHRVPGAADLRGHHAVAVHLKEDLADRAHPFGSALFGRVAEAEHCLDRPEKLNREDLKSSKHFL